MAPPAGSRRRQGYKKRTQAEVARDTAKALELHYEGYGVREIGPMLGLSYGTVFRDLRKATQAYKEANQEFINTVVLQAVEDLDRVEAEAWSSWFESLEDSHKERIKSVANPPKPGAKPSAKAVVAQLQEVVKEITQRCGDPRFLTVITRCALAKAKLFESLSLKKTDNDIWLKIYQELTKVRASRRKTAPPPETPPEPPAA